MIVCAQDKLKRSQALSSNVQSESAMVKKYRRENHLIDRMYFQWHSSNPFPWPPYFSKPDPRNPSNKWPGNDVHFGSKFLSFNRHLVRDFESWRAKKQLPKLSPWNPASRMPFKLTHSERKNHYTKFPIEPWLTVGGSETAESATLNRKLSDFSNPDQLGIVISWWSYAVYESIWGNISSEKTVLQDPIFWKFSKFVDNVLRTWERITGINFDGLIVKAKSLNDNVDFLANYAPAPMPPNTNNLHTKGGHPKINRKLSLEFEKSKDQNLTFVTKQSSDMKRIRMHVRIISYPVGEMTRVQELVNSAVQLFAAKANINIEVVTVEKQSGDVETYFVKNAVNIPQKCTNELTDDTNKLFNSRPKVRDGELVAYFVNQTNPPVWGCTYMNEKIPACLVTQDPMMPKWVLAHEIGHSLGLQHREDYNPQLPDDQNALMNLNVPKHDPTFDIEELKGMEGSWLYV